jgi:hypothetical protein
MLCVDNITTHITLRGVLLAPDLKKHLISPDRLVEGGYVVTHNRRGCDVCHERTNERLLWASRQSGMLVVPMHPCTPTACAQATREKQTVTMDELHRRMGHVGEARLRFRPPSVTPTLRQWLQVHWSERLNRTIVNMAHAMLIELYLPKPLWSEAMPQHYYPPSLDQGIQDCHGVTQCHLHGWHTPVDRATERQQQG